MGVLGSLEGLLAEEETTGRAQTPTLLQNQGARMPYGVGTVREIEDARVEGLNPGNSCNGGRFQRLRG